MALHLLRHKHRFHLNPSLFRIFSTSSSNVPSQSPFPNFFTEKPLGESRRKYSPSKDSGDVFDRRKAEETQSRVGRTEQPKEEKRRRVERPKKQVVEQKPIDETQSRAASISGTRRKKVNALSSSSRNELKMNHPDYICSVTHAMDILNDLPRVKKWTPLYRASMDHLMADVAHRQAFLSFSDPEDRIKYLRYKTQKAE